MGIDFDAAERERFESLVAASLDRSSEFPEGSRGQLLIARARAAFQPRSFQRWSLVVRRIADRVEALAISGDIMAPLLARGSAPADLLVRARLGSQVMTTHIGAGGGARSGVVVSVDVWGAGPGGSEGEAKGEAGDGDAMRLTLMRDGRELASEQIRSRRVMLPDLGPGQYRVIVSDREGATVGELDLRVERPTA